jgi:hypothetical protein
MRLLIFLTLFAFVAQAQDKAPVRPFASNHKTATTVFKSDSVAVKSYGGTIRFSLTNPSATDTLKVALCNTWADTAVFIRIPPGKDFNYFGDRATIAPYWISTAGVAGSIAGRVIIIY